MGLRFSAFSAFSAMRAVVLAAAAGALVSASLGGRSVHAAGPVRIVILPIVVHSAAADAAYVSRGISDMISSRLEQTGRVRVERVEDPGAATTLVGSALRAGQSRRGDYVIYGAFTQFGEGASLDIHCIPLDVRDEAEAEAARRIFIQSGSVGEIIPKIDAIVDRVSRFVKVEPRAGTSPPGPAAAGGPAPGAGVDDANLRALRERLDALERAVFGGDASTAAQAAPPPPES